MRFKEFPVDILKKMGIYEPQDIDLDLVAFHLNAEVRRAALSDCEGHIIGTSDKAIITIDRDAYLPRQRFSLGHELGHWINDRGKNLTYRCTTEDMRCRWNKGNSQRQQIEARANSFSSQLLMPEHILPKYQDGADITYDSIKQLAEVFNVSRTSMAIRFVETNLLPCMLVCWQSSGRRKWFTRNKIVSESIWPHSQILSPQSAFITSNGVEVDADKWISADNAGDFSIVESVFTNSYEFFSLIWWKDEAQLA